MALKLSFETLGDLDKGRLGKVLEKHIKTVKQDCYNRPCDASGKPADREILIKLKITPRLERGDLGEVNLAGVTCETEIASKIPKHVSNPVKMNVSNDGLFFNPDDNTNPDQMSLLDGVDAE